MLVIARLEVTAEGSDAPMQMNIGQIYSFKDGWINRVASYYDVQVAVEAAGLTDRDVRKAPGLTPPPAPL